MKIDLYTITGTKKGQVAASDTIFSAEINRDLMHRSVVMRLANKRNPIAHTKTRGEIVGTTKKAYKQKGTGRARRGALKTNLLRGGGVTHGPRNTRNFTLQMPKKERRKALFSSLSAQAQDDALFALESHNWKDPKTKQFAELLAKLPAGKKYLFVIDKKDPVFEKSIANVPNVRVILAQYLNPYDVLGHDKICFLQDALVKTEATFLADKK